VTAIAAPADRRFRRAHVRPSRKRRVWRAVVRPALRYGVLAGALLFGVYRGVGVVAHARVLQVDRIVVRGNERLSRGEVLAVLNGLRGQSLIWTDLNGCRRRLLAIGWVRDAALRRSLPSTIEVDLLERKPMGIGRIRGEMFLVDDHGVLIDQYGPQYADLDLPIIDGLSGSGPGTDSPADAPRADLAARLLTTLKPRPDIAQRVSQIDVTDPHNLSVILAGDSAVIRIGEDQFLPRLQVYLDVATILHERVPDVDSVDLRFDNRIYVRPAARPARGGTALGDAARLARRENRTSGHPSRRKSGA
jgi:cell division protein FtsQ